MTSRVERLRAAYAAYNSGNVESVLEWVSDDIEVRPPPSSVEPQPLRGRDALVGYLEPNLFEFQRADPQEFVEHGDRILVAVNVRARGRGSGVELNDVVFHVWTADGEQVVRFEVFLDRDQAEAALRA